MLDQTNAVRLATLDGDVLAPGEGVVTVVAALHPLQSRHRTLRVPAGLSVAEILAGLPAESRIPPAARVWLNGHELAPEYWRLLRPKAGTHLLVAVVPRDGNTALRLALTAGVIAASIYAPYLAPGIVPGTFGAAALSAGVGFAAPIVVNALEPPV